MTKRIIAGILLAAMLFALAGCSSAFKKRYTSITDYTGTQADEDGIEPRLIADYDELKSAIVSAVSRHLSHDRYKFVNYEGNLRSDLEDACEYVSTQTAIGSYAAETISGDLSRIITYYEATVYITYKKTEEDVSAISYVSGKKALPDGIVPMLEGLETEKVFSINSSTVTAEDVTWAVFLALAKAPASSVILPTAEVSIYPEAGTTRIVELKLTYGKQHGEISAMELMLGERAEEYAAQGADAAALCSALRERCVLLTPGAEAGENAGNAYGSVVESKADSSGLALGYKVICDTAGLDCAVVTGTLNGEFHCWNAVKTDEGYRYYDAASPRCDGLTGDALRAQGYAWDETAFIAEPTEQ